MRPIRARSDLGVSFSFETSRNAELDALSQNGGFFDKLRGFALRARILDGGDEIGASRVRAHR